MAEVWFDPEADAALGIVEADANRHGLARALNEVVDRLEADPRQAEVRRRRYAEGYWGVPVRWRDEAWLLIWEPHPDQAGDVVVQYIGPDL